jgi:hypothetical protein
MICAHANPRYLVFAAVPYGVSAGPAKVVLLSAAVLGLEVARPGPMGFTSHHKAWAETCAESPFRCSAIAPSRRAAVRRGDAPRYPRASPS